MIWANRSITCCLSLFYQRKLQERRLDESDDDDGDSGLKEMMQKHTEERMTLLAREDGDADKLEEEMEAVSWAHCRHIPNYIPELKTLFNIVEAPF